MRLHRALRLDLLHEDREQDDAHRDHQEDDREHPVPVGAENLRRPGRIASHTECQNSITYEIAQ